MNISTDWIGCQNQMPEYDERVLICTSGCGVFIAELKEKPVHDEDCWLFDGDTGEDFTVLDSVVYWMPLPSGIF